ncbi:MAG: mandelate racemase/muconate lactonizing enzyme family protein [Chloroflexi bacterium]|nr:mandelate racemase/muconate lactonizing enzyme family protein [Chloroflexota bacterium]
MTGLSWTTFRLSLRAPFRTAAGEVTERHGLVLRLATDAGLVGLGEASPHPAVGLAALREVEAALGQVAPRVIGADAACLDTLCASLPPALACAIDVAACDALARARGVSVAGLLSQRVRTEVPVNATIGAERADDAAREAAAHRAGFRCVKLKVGLASDVAEERERVAAVRDALGPEIVLRLDANGAWDPERAIRTIQTLEPYNLELVEQPVPAGDLDGLRRVQQAVATPIAADETITGLEAAQRVLELCAARVLVVKPMVVGGLRPARKIIEIAVRAGVSVVVTTTIDAGIGVAAALHLAATLPEDSPACGLATGSFLADDIVARPVAPRGGVMALPDGPGLGIELDEVALSRYAVSHGEVRS